MGNPNRTTSSVSPLVTAWDRRKATGSASCPVIVRDCERPPPTMNAGPCVKEVIATPQTVLETALTTEQPIITVELHCEEFLTVSSLADSDLEISLVSDMESPLDDSDIDETYNPTKEEQEETESSSNSTQSGQEEELTDDQVPEDIVEKEAHKRPKRKKGINYRRQNMENRRLGKEYKVGKKVGSKTIEVT